jgi:hypothetical protein
MSDGPVQGFFISLWERRGDPNALRSDPQIVALVHLLHRAIVSQIDLHPAYDPELDHRVLWSREVLAAARNPVPGRAPRASADLEGMAQYLLKVGPFAPGAPAADDDDDPETMFPR